MLTDFLFNPFFWDRDVYKFNRLEKDMNPYSVHKEENGITLVHNVVGLSKDDLKIKVEENNGKSKLIISGDTKNEKTNSNYSVHSEFMLDSNKKIKDITSKLENGLLYITIEYEKTENIIKNILNIINSTSYFFTYGF